MKLHGTIDFNSLITFLESDTEEAPDSRNDVFDIALFGFPNLNAMSYKCLHLASLESHYEVNILHEKVHSWQMLSSPLFLIHYLNNCKKIYTQSAKYNFNKNKLSNTYPNIDDENSKSVNDLCYSFDMNMYAPTNGSDLIYELRTLYKNQLINGFSGTWTDFTYSLFSSFENSNLEEYFRILSTLDIIPRCYNGLERSQPVAMPMLRYHHKIENQDYIAYCGLLDFFEIVYFSGQNIMESFAFVNDCLRNNIPIPEYDSYNDHEQNTYLGIFEFYRRVVGPLYHNTRDLAVSFLAIIDIALCPDIFGNHKDEYENDEDYRQENVSLAYRLGKLIFRAQGFHPLRLPDGDFIETIVQWQDDYCRYQELTTIDESLKNTIAHLLAILVFDLYPYINITDEVRDAAISLYVHKGDWHIQLPIVVNFLNNIPSDSQYTCQHDFLSSITNTLYYKLNNRGKLVVPCYFEDELDSSISTSLFVYNGNYYCNLFKNSSNFLLNKWDSFNYGAIDNLVMTEWGNKGTESCGFNENNPCMFQSNGFGCPLKGLTENQKMKRKAFGMPYCWCHRDKLLKDLAIKH